MLIIVVVLILVILYFSFFYLKIFKKRYHCCDQGCLQSPINLTSKIEAELAPIEFIYQKIVPKTGKHQIVEKEKSNKNYIKIDKEVFLFLQFHVHCPGEHLIEGKKFPAELHIVHKNTNEKENNLAVIGIMLEEQSEDSEIFNYIIKSEEFDLKELLPESKIYYRLMGSLTTAPHKENINWYIMQKPIGASKKQIKELYKIFELKSRDLQPVNNRLIVKGI